MILMRQELGEELVSEIRARTADGDGRLYVTSHAVAYEVDGRGLYLNFVPRDQIRQVRAGNGRLFGERRYSLHWDEGGQDHVFEFRTSECKKMGEMWPGIHAVKSENIERADLEKIS